MPDEKEKSELAVFSVLTPTNCSECKTEVGKGDFLRIENETPLCLECADLAHLTFLPSGDTALTRRSKKGSKLWAIVLRFNKSRKRYERLGMLVEPAALETAEQACAADAGSRLEARAKAVGKREIEDEKYKQEFLRQILLRYPACPVDEAETISLHACAKYSGRVGRSASAKNFDANAIDLAVRAHIRHVHTNYDELLLKGVDRKEARRRIGQQVDDVQRRWH